MGHWHFALSFNAARLYSSEICRFERLKGWSARLFLGVLMELDHRRGLLREGWRDVGRVFVFALILDVICQFVVFRWVYPGETLLVATVLGNVPYLLVRGPVNRIASSGSKGRGGR